MIKWLEQFGPVQREEEGSKTDIASIGCMIDFTIMMVLDVALG